MITIYPPFMGSYPSHPGSKVSGPSREAAKAEKGRAPYLRNKVMALMNQPVPSYAAWVGYTADECAQLLNESILSIRPRLSELVKMGRIEDTGIRRKNASGKWASVWRSRRTYAQKELL